MASNPEPAKRVTIADVARRAGTSKGTVSFVLNGRPGISEVTRERVLQAVEELGWTPSQSARSLATSRAYALGLILARDPRSLGADPFFAPMIAGVEIALSAAGQSLVLKFAPDEGVERATYESLASQRHVDGVILSDLLHDDHRIALLQSLGMPAVTLNTPDIESPFPAVVRSDDPGVREAVEHLAGLGHRSIAFVGGPDRYLHSRRRRDVWQRTSEELGLELGPFVESDFTAAGGAAATRQLLDGAPQARRPTAIMYGNDLMAASGMACALQLGLRAPEDLSIVGFDDTELSAHLAPALTTVSTDPMAWGEAAARALLELVNAGHSSKVTLPPAGLIIRESSGPAPRR